MKGISTGNHKFDKVKFQKKIIKFEHEFFYGDFTVDNLKPTPEQIEFKKKRNEKQAKLNAKKYERSHRGGYSKTKKGVSE